MSVETAMDTARRNEDAGASAATPARAGLVRDRIPIEIDPDLDFIRDLSRQTGDTLKKCFQCGTCSATCLLAPDRTPFPRKEMAWAVWGMKDRLLEDPDIWLCYQCGDCSTRCPRGARPGDVLAALRQKAIIHNAFPRFFGRWLNQPQAAPLMLGIPMALVTAALLLKNPIGNALGIADTAGGRIVYSYSNVLPHWLLNGFFILVVVLASAMMAGGMLRLWRAMKDRCGPEGAAAGKALLPSFFSAARIVIEHDKFARCTKEHDRYWSHLPVFFGFTALLLVTLWVITAPYNPLIRGDFIYPFGFWNPWKILANAGGASLLAGIALMTRDRLKDEEKYAATTYFDWTLIATLAVVVLTGFLTEVLHYVRLEPHRHLAYFAHLVFVCGFLLYLPYSKFAHAFYRTAALAAAERYGRETAPARRGEKGGLPEYEEETLEKAAKAGAVGGQATLALVLVLVLLIPFGYSAISRAVSGNATEPFLERPDPKYKNCVRDTDYMHSHHWELLRGVREQVVRYGIRGDITLSKCRECHTSRERFCNRCHDSVSLTPDCFECHYYP